MLIHSMVMCFPNADFSPAGTYNVDITGAGSIATTSVSTCQTACDGMSNCVGFAWNDATNCWLKSGIAVPSTVSNNCFLIKRIPGYVTLIGYDANPSSNLASYGIISDDVCASKCNTLSSCNGFTLSKTSGCYSKSTISPSAVTNVFSFIKVVPINGYVAWINTEFTGYSSPNHDTASAISTTTFGANCATSCTSNSNCVAFAIEYGTGSSAPCYFKDIASNPGYGVANKVSYLKNV